MFPLLLRIALLIAHSSFPSPLRVAASDPVELELEQAARQYRIQSYNAHRLDRAELDRHRALLDTALARWRAAGASDEDRDSLIAWLNAATDAVRNRRETPPIPDFDRDSPQRLADATPNANLPAPIPPRTAQRTPSDRLARRPKTAHRASATSQIAQLAAPPSDAKFGEPRLNLAELHARASGYQVAMRTVNSVLHNDEPLNLRQLGTLLDELESLLTTRSDLLVYHELTPGGERARIDELLAFPEPTIVQFRFRVAGLRDEVLFDADLPAAARDALVKAIDNLSERLENRPEN